MKKFFALLSLAAFSSLAYSQNVSIKGVITNNQADSVLIESFVPTDMVKKKVKLSNTGDFEVKLTIVSAGYFKLGIDDNNYMVLVLHPGDKIEVAADALNMYGTARVTGSPSTSQFYAANLKFSQFKNQKDSVKAEADRQVQLLDLKEEHYAIQYIKQNPRSLTSLMMAERANKEEYYDVLFMLDSNLYREYPANKMVQDFHAEVSKLTFLKVGTKVPDIKLMDKNGKPVSLSSLRGKLVLIDFWATWCGPCKAEIPNLKRIYASYKDKGFEIFSVSIDRSKDQWVSGSKDLPWVSVFDDGGVVASQFNVSSIPFMMLVDKEGTIVAKNIRGNQLYLKVSDMMQ